MSLWDVIYLAVTVIADLKNFATIEVIVIPADVVDVESTTDVMTDSVRVVDPSPLDFRDGSDKTSQSRKKSLL